MAPSSPGTRAGFCCGHRPGDPPGIGPSEDERLNGVDLVSILAARQAMTDAPPAAGFVWRADDRWVSGTHCTTTFDDFFGVGAEQAHREPFHADSDHPERFASHDNGPVEWLLHSLAG